jgi:hypothetical protein
MNFGKWEGKTYEDLKEVPLYQRWLSDPISYSLLWSLLKGFLLAGKRLLKTFSLKIFNDVQLLLTAG